MTIEIREPNGREVCRSDIPARHGRLDGQECRTYGVCRVFVLAIVVSLGLNAYAISAEYRTWTTANGRKSDVELKVINQNETHIQLQREDNGKKVVLRLNQLSEADRTYLRKMRGTDIPDGHTNNDGEESPSHKPDYATYTSVVRPFFQTHCIKCHGPETQESEFRIDDQLPNDFLSREVVAKWTEVLNMLNAGDMPPEGEPRPLAADSARVAAWIEKERLRGERSNLDRGIVLRRMNREEYNNTIRDLIGLDLRPADAFPEDPPAGGFDNNGGALSISPLHMEMYLQAAAKVLDRAILPKGAQRPTPVKWHFEVDELPQNHRWEQDGIPMFFSRRAKKIEDGMVVQRIDGYEGDKFYLSIRGMPQTGDYVIRVRAGSVVPSAVEARRAGNQMWHNRLVESLAKITDPQKRKNKQAEYNGYFFPESKRHFDNDPAYALGPPRLQFYGRIDGSQEVLGEMDVDAPRSQPEVYEVRKRIHAGVDAQFTIDNVYKIPNHQWNWSSQKRDDFPRTVQYIDWLEIEGPVVDQWPPASHSRIFFDSPNKSRGEEAYARDILTRFAQRAFRRPLRDGELDPYLELFKSVRPNKPSIEEAIKTPLTAMLASPKFLYLTDSALTLRVEHSGKNIDSESQATLSDFELASRLSYFLWSTMPDDELFRSARQGQLSKSTTLAAQVDRMLADPKANALAENFAGQWLGLREIGANPPVYDRFPRYDRHLEKSMRLESEQFFAHILNNDRPVTDFLKSDYVIINERMARFYNIPGVKGDHFRRVAVPSGTARGGLTTQASILAITSNGTRTSPVWRGVWILERLLGDPPGSPPPDAGDIPPAQEDLSKATVRQRLQAHRNHVQCARCHNKIDPLGFALENFDASGFWRIKEPSGMFGSEQSKDPVIDASARMPDGTQIEGVAGLQSELLKRKDKFIRHLAHTMATYALGREMSFADDEWIDSLAVGMTQNGETLRGLVKDIVRSEQFRSK